MTDYLLWKTSVFFYPTTLKQMGFRVFTTFLNKMTEAHFIQSLKNMEARVGIEPTIEDLQSSALPLGDRAINGKTAR